MRTNTCDQPEDPYEYTVAGSPVAVSRHDDGNTIYTGPLPGRRTLDGSLAEITPDQAEKLKRSLDAALIQEKN